jgi:hypothetical protein
MLLKPTNVGLADITGEEPEEKEDDAGLDEDEENEQRESNKAKKEVQKLDSEDDTFEDPMGD